MSHSVHEATKASYPARMRRLEQVRDPPAWRPCTGRGLPSADVPRPHPPGTISVRRKRLRLFNCLAVATAVLIVSKAGRLRLGGWATALGLLLAGAVGNLCDRLMRAPSIGRSAVVDFIDVQHFADFNVADSCLTCGVVLAVWLSLRRIPIAGRSPGLEVSP